MLRPTPGDPWGVEQHHWNTGQKKTNSGTPVPCNTLFSENTYLNRHKKKFISAAATSAPSDNDSQVASSETQDENFDEWDRDPEIDLDYSEGESSEEEEPSEASNDTAKIAEDKNRELTLGRIERKRTSPGPVKAPIKRKETDGC